MNENEKVLTDMVIEMSNRITKLKQLILLTDPVVSNVEMNETAKKQWLEYIRCFPYEASDVEY
jgi:hypothetical protein